MLNFEKSFRYHTVNHFLRFVLRGLPTMPIESYNRKEIIKLNKKTFEES